MTDPNKQTSSRVQASATGCAVLDAKVSTWLNRAKEVNPGWACQVRVGTLHADNFAERDNAIEAIAVQLETLARKIRQLKEGK